MNISALWWRNRELQIQSRHSLSHTNITNISTVQNSKNWQSFVHWGVVWDGHCGGHRRFWSIDDIIDIPWCTNATSKWLWYKEGPLFQKNSLSIIAYSTCKIETLLTVVSWHKIVSHLEIIWNNSKLALQPCHSSQLPTIRCGELLRGKNSFYRMWKFLRCNILLCYDLSISISIQLFVLPSIMCIINKIHG